MPNWVYSSLKITSDDKTLLKEYQEKFKTPEMEFSLNTIITRPEDKDVDWYDWNVSNWGTKWDVSDVETNHSEGELVYSFSTAWSAPMPVIEKLMADPKLRIVLFYEEEQGWGGQLIMENSVISEHQMWDIPSKHAEAMSRPSAYCYCIGNDEQYYEDCFYARASEIEGITPRILEYVKGLAPSWSEGFDSLLAAAHKL